MNRIELSRLNQLKEIDFDWEGRSVLYIGAYEGRFHFGEFLNNNCIVDVLEIDHNACEYLRSLHWLNGVIEGNVLDISNLVSRKYHVVFWSHGPETVEKSYFEFLIKELNDIAKELVVVMVPWGNYPYSDNITPLYEEDFERLGFETSVLGEKNKRNSNLLAWKFKEE